MEKHREISFWMVLIFTATIMHGLLNIWTQDYGVMHPSHILGSVMAFVYLNIIGRHRIPLPYFLSVILVSSFTMNITSLGLNVLEVHEALTEAIVHSFVFTLIDMSVIGLLYIGYRALPGKEKLNQINNVLQIVMLLVVILGFASLAVNGLREAYSYWMYAVERVDFHLLPFGYAVGYDWVLMMVIGFFSICFVCRRAEEWGRRLMETAVPNLVVYIIAVALSAQACSFTQMAGISNEINALYMMAIGGAPLGCHLVTSMPFILMSFLFLSLYYGARLFSGREFTAKGLQKFKHLSERQREVFSVVWKMGNGRRLDDIACFSSVSLMQVSGAREIVMYLNTPYGEVRRYRLTREKFQESNIEKERDLSEVEVRDAILVNGEFIELDILREEHYQTEIGELEYQIAHNGDQQQVEICTHERIVKPTFEGAPVQHEDRIYILFDNFRSNQEKEVVLHDPYDDSDLVEIVEIDIDDEVDMIKTVTMSAFTSLQNIWNHNKIQNQNESLKISKTVLDNMEEGMLLVSSNMIIADINESFSAHFEIDERLAVGRGVFFLRHLLEVPSQILMITRTLREQGEWEGDLHCYGSQGPITIRATCKPVLMESGCLYYAFIFSDVTELLSQANTDEMTGFYNRRKLIESIDELIQLRKKTGGDKRIGCVFVDLDRFKNVNDTMGHKAGDQLLQQVAARLRPLTHRGDIIGRVGGDEFAVMLFDPGSDDTRAVQMSKAMLDELRRPFNLNEGVAHISGSFGISYWPTNGDNAETILSSSDAAMYQIKHGGRQGIAVYDHTMTDGKKEEAQLINDFRDAMEQGGLELYYQPQVETDTHKVVGMEALLRWRRLDGEVVGPGYFMDAVKSADMMKDLDDWVLTEGFRQASEWQSRGLDMVKMSLNVSGIQMANKDLIEKLDRLQRTYGVNPADIEIEISEDFVMKQEEDAIERLNMIRSRGYRVSIDDFGTGYSCLSYLKKLPIDTLKIDSSFIRGIPGDRDDEAICQTIISLADNMALSVIAEGVETEEQRQFLQNSGASVYQGYYFSMPIPATEIERYFNK